jgi:DNA mismatch repair protein MutS2
MIYPGDFEQKLGFNQIRQRLKNYCLSSLGIRLVDEMNFSSHFETIKSKLRQNLEFKQVLEKAETFPSANYFDPQQLWPTIAIEGSFIEEESFHSIILSLQSIFEAKQFLAKASEIYLELNYLAERVVVDKKLLYFSNCNLNLMM